MSIPTQHISVAFQSSGSLPTKAAARGVALVPAFDPSKVQLKKVSTPSTSKKEGNAPESNIVDFRNNLKKRT